MNKKIFIFLSLILVFGTTACADKWQQHDLPELPVDPEPETKPLLLEKMLWFDAEANFERFSTKEGIITFLDKTKWTGFNKIVVDVRPVQGDVLYESEFMTKLKTLNGIYVNRDWDYLQFFIEEAKKRDLKVTVSTTIFPAGLPSTRSGPAYRDAKWTGKTCLQYTPNGMVDIKDDPSKVAAFLSPVYPEVRNFALKMIKEIVTKYDFDGYALDYCRFPDGESDFSQAAKSLFEGYVGQTINNWPEDIYSYNPDGTRNAGPYYAKWWEFRSSLIHNFVSDAQDAIKAIKPQIKLEYWAASWWQALYNNGQNWASKTYNPYYQYAWWATPEYYKTGFADKIDTFLLGAYLSRIYGPEDPESIEYAINRAKQIIGKDCAIYGTIDCSKKEFDIEEAVYYCMLSTQGVMVFDIVHVINNNKWDAIKKGIERAEAKLAASL